MDTKKRISEEEVKEEIDRSQGEVDNPRPKNKPDPVKIERDYTGEPDGDPDDTTPDQENDLIEKQIDEGPIEPLKNPKP